MTLQFLNNTNQITKSYHLTIENVFKQADGRWFIRFECTPEDAEAVEHEDTNILFVRRIPDAVKPVSDSK